MSSTDHDSANSGNTVQRGPRAMAPTGRAVTDRSVVAGMNWRHWCLIVFILSLLLPTETSFYVGSLRLTPYRLVLIIGFVPCIYLLVSGAVGRIRVPDYLMALHASWAIITFGLHHGLDVATEAGGIYMIETFGAYCIARILIRDATSFVFFARVLVTTVLFLMPLLVIESVTGQHFIKDLFSKISGQTFSSTLLPRFGFARAYGPFDHPILAGVFCASAIGLAWYAFQPKGDSRIGRFLRTIGVVIATLSSVSSGAAAALNTQVICIVWDRATRGYRHRWKALGAGIIAAYMLIGALSNRTGLKVLLSYLTFSTATAYSRLLIWEYGSAEVVRHPLFGIGYNEWVRPTWMGSGSMDAFWLVVAVRHGLPAFLLLAGAVLYTVFASRRATGTNSMLQRGWVVSMAGLIVAACTVHFWNQSLVYFCFLSGAGVWMCNERETTRGA